MPNAGQCCHGKGACQRSYVDYGTYLKNRKCVGPSDLCTLQYKIEHGHIDFGCIKQAGGVVIINCDLEVNAPRFIHLNSHGTITETADEYIEMVAGGGASHCSTTPAAGDISMSAKDTIMESATKAIRLRAGDACPCKENAAGEIDMQSGGHAVCPRGEERHGNGGL